MFVFQCNFPCGWQHQTKKLRSEFPPSFFNGNGAGWLRKPKTKSSTDVSRWMNVQLSQKKNKSNQKYGNLSSLGSVVACFEMNNEANESNVQIQLCNFHSMWEWKKFALSASNEAQHFQG